MMSWMQRLKRVFRIDIKDWPQCGGRVRIIACIESPEMRILDQGNHRIRRKPITYSDSIRSLICMCGSDFSNDRVSRRCLHFRFPSGSWAWK